MAVTYTIVLALKPGRAETFLALLAPVLDAMRAEASFINAVLHRDPTDPDRFMLYETWADAAELAEVEMRRAYRATYWQALPDLLREERGIAAWQPLRADFGRAPVAKR
ncbi:putative quinol monooxygenase [Phreatobacter sp. AB_2022a]|uniref:putative quinol monooxygenase n=1 Tax=Phreatobacter sp. AB_2022a TaxID=3003134 RepID=UPI0022870327|nr:putative quinol monooxygenase [Phreatobacter sp. AB_2022a]MCZ0734483.1 putative quinol monooxygenase [Phreatobacter sp. AB_2022a]